RMALSETNETSGTNDANDTGDRALLSYAGLLSQRPRSAAGLRRMLQHHFRVLVYVEQFAGVWRNIEENQWTRLGAYQGRNHILGKTAAIGSRFWDPQGRFWIALGPLTLRQFVHFLPGGQAHLALCEMTRFYAGEEMDFRLRLRLRAAEIPETRLLHPAKIPAKTPTKIKDQQPGRSRLGWTTWLKTRPMKHDSQVAIAPRLAGSR
ncbi:MAG TPA: type VI secretion system baseplate subunit TssG, partial [Candidatus Saccharimonadales bacterium]|nr:type VI secretion system baseplate subunit TssG [Candidatus Saccharimonadales bacterium]